MVQYAINLIAESQIWRKHFFTINLQHQNQISYNMRRKLAILLSALILGGISLPLSAETVTATGSIKIILTKKRSLNTRPERKPAGESPFICERDGKYIMLSGEMDGDAFACVADINTAARWSREFSFPTPCAMITTSGAPGEYSIGVVVNGEEYEGFFTIEQ